MRRRTSAHGRALWPMVLLLACAMVATDFVRHPFQGAAPGDAATARQDVTLWLAGTDAGTTPARLARIAVRRLDGPRERARTQTVRGGSSAAVLAVLDREPGAGAALLVVHAGTLADLERERRDTNLPGVPEQATRAARLLRAATPVALLADDALLLAAARRDGPRDGAALLASLRTTPERLVFGIGRDAWSKAALAAFVGAAGVSGRVPYRTLPTIGAAGSSLSGPPIDVVLAPASELRAATAARGALRPLARSTTDGRQPGNAPTAAATAAVPTLASLLGADGAAVERVHRWVALVAPPTLRGRDLARVTRRVRQLADSAPWQRVLRRAGLSAPQSDEPPPLRRAWRETATLVTAAARVDRLDSTP